MDLATADREQLLDEVRRLRAALGAARLGWYQYDPAERSVTLDARCAELFGIVERRKAAADFFSLIDPAFHHLLRAKLAAALDPGEPQPFELEYAVNRPNGTVCWVEARGVAEFEGAHAHRRAVRFVGTVADITESRRTEAALTETSQLLALFLKHSPIYAFIKEVTPAGSRVLTASENFDELVGIPGSQMAGKTMEELFPAEFAAKITQDDRTVVEGGRVLRLDEDLGGRHYNTVKFPIHLHGRDLLAGYTIDITERKRAAQEVSRLLDQAREDASTKEWLLRELNHRVNNNLLILQGLLVTEKLDTPDEGRRWVDASVDRLSNWVRGLTSVNRILTATHWVPVPLDELSDLVLRQALAPALSAGVLTLEVGRFAERVSSQRASKLALVLNELATNTLKYAVPCRPHVTVAVSMRDEGAFYAIEYREDGPGYPAAILEGGRPSVGLRVVSELVAATLGGSLTLSNDGGAVATIRVRREELPAAQSRPAPQRYGSV